MYCTTDITHSYFYYRKMTCSFGSFVRTATKRWPRQACPREAWNWTLSISTALINVSNNKKRNTNIEKLIETVTIVYVTDIKNRNVNSNNILFLLLFLSITTVTTTSSITIVIETASVGADQNQQRQQRNERQHLKFNIFLSMFLLFVTLCPSIHGKYINGSFPNRRGIWNNHSLERTGKPMRSRFLAVTSTNKQLPLSSKPHAPPSLPTASALGHPANGNGELLPLSFFKYSAGEQQINQHSKRKSR